MKFNRLIKQAGLVFVMLFMAVSFSVLPVNAGYSGWGPVTHAGKYYFKFNYLNYKVYISTNKNSGYKETSVDGWPGYTDGKRIIYVSDREDAYSIKSYDINKKKIKVLKKLSKDTHWEVAGANGNYLWIYSRDKGIYSFNVKTKALKLQKKNALLFQLRGPYYLCSYGKDKRIEVSDETIFGMQKGIYELTKSGKLKQVCKMGTVYNETDDIYMVKNYGKFKKIYYSANNSHDLYSVNTNGKNKKKIKSFKGYIVSVHEKYCIIYDGSKYQKYIFKSGKIVKATSTNY